VTSKGTLSLHHETRLLAKGSASDLISELWRWALCWPEMLM
jgi:hypothetical protein